MKNLIVSIASSLILSACALVPAVAPTVVAMVTDVTAKGSGVGTADESDLREITAKTFNLPVRNVKVSNINKENHPIKGSDITYNVQITVNKKIKRFRCTIHSTWLADDSKANCYKPGESQQEKLLR